ncbi:Sec-independent protein translocase subunit TatA [Corynebacterium variabile]|nr:Sec-independent protein translocase subunit TatA [Corynebacterium variabile]
MGNLGWPEILIIVVVLLLLFGATRLPNMARSLGRSMRIFKSEMKEMKNDDKPAVEAPAVSPEAEAARRIADPSSVVNDAAKDAESRES